MRQPITVDDCDDPWFVIGEYLGYPLCCIEAFMQLAHLGKGKRKLSGTGFIPCHECNESKSPAELILEINRNRSCPVPFPDVRQVSYTHIHALMKEKGFE